MLALPLASNCTVMFLHSAVGNTLSTTVTMASHVATLSLLSVTVSLTVFGPTLAQVNALLSMARLLMPQASLLPLLTSAAVMLALPLASNCTLMFLHSAVGNTLSATVTMASHVATLSLLSVTVSLTVFGPTLAQVNAFFSMARLLIPHASLLLLLTSAAVMLALPLASNCTVMFLHSAAGNTLSTTVTIASLVAALPLLSVTVSLTVFGPTLAQVNALLS